MKFDKYLLLQYVLLNNYERIKLIGGLFSSKKKGS